MNIGKDWKIESDNLNVKLFHKLKRTNREGKKYDEWAIHGYFATPKEALKELVNQEVRDTELKDLETIVAEIDKLHKLIAGLLLNTPPKRARQATEALK